MNTNLAEKFVELDSVGEVWDYPVPLEKSSPPIFPVEALPEPGKQIVKAVATSVQVDVALPASAYLGMLSLGCQRLVQVQPRKGWKEETALWILAVAGISEKKSPILRLMLKPVYDFEREIRKSASSEVAKLKAKRDALEARYAKLKAEAGKGGLNDNSEFEQIADELLSFPIPALPRMIADNSTEEKLGVLMQQNGERMMIASTEPTLFDQIAGSRDRKPLLDIYLKAFTGDPMIVDRITRENVTLERPQLSLLITAQPDAVQGVLSNKRLEGRGVLSRFLYAPCLPLAGSRSYDAPPLSDKALEQYSFHVKSHLSQKAERVLTLSQEADLFLGNYYHEIEERLAPGKDLGEMTGWAGKQIGNTLRLSALIHTAETTDTSDNTISLGVMERAVTLSRYFIAGFLYLRRILTETPKRKKARELWFWMIQQEKFIAEDT